MDTSKTSRLNSDSDVAYSTQDDGRGNPAGTGTGAVAGPGNSIGAEPSVSHDNEPASTEYGTVEVDNNKTVFKPTRSFLLAFSALLVLTMAFALDATTLSVALPIISTSLGGSALEAFWSGTSFLLASTVLQPTMASFSSIFGRKYVIYVDIVFFAAGSLVSALAGNFTVLIAGRTIQGIGGGGLIAVIEVVITDLVPLAVRPNYLSIFSVIYSVATVTGPMIGAGFAQNVSWRWIYYINLPIIGVGLAFVVLFLHQAKIPGGIAQKLGRFDWLGCFLFTASATSFLYGLTTGGVAHPWSSGKVLAPLIIGLFGLILFGIWEFRFAVEPLINKRILQKRDLVLTYILTVLHSAILWSLLYFMPLYYEAVKFYSPVIASIAILPETLTVAPAAVVVGIITGITGHYRWSLWGGWVITTLGAGLLLLLRPDTTVPAWIWLNVPVGMGTGMLFPAMALSIQASSPPELNGQAIAFFSFLRSFGQSIGIAISGVIFQNSFKKKLRVLPAFASVADVYSRDATSVVAVIKAMPASDNRTDLVKAYNDSLRDIWISILAFGAFSLVLSLAVRSHSLNQEHVSDQKIIEKEPYSAEGASNKEKLRPEP